MKQNYELRRGDTWTGIPSLLIRDSNGDPLPSEVVSAEMMLRPSFGARKVVMTFSTADGTIGIEDAGMGWITIPPRLMDVPAGIYYYDLQVTYADGRVLSPLNGTMTLNQDATRDA